MDAVVAGGVIGVGGTLLGTVANGLLQEFTLNRRLKREARARSRRAVIAVSGELLAGQSVLMTCLEQDAWWPDTDAPLDQRWEQHHDALLDALDADSFESTKQAYESIRSLKAVRDEALAELPTQSGRRTLAVRRSGWSPGAQGVVQSCFDGNWIALRQLRNAQARYARKDDPESVTRPLPEQSKDAAPYT